MPPNIVQPTANLIPSPAPGPILPTIKGTIAISVDKLVIIMGLNLLLQDSTMDASTLFPLTLN